MTFMTLYARHYAPISYAIRSRLWRRQAPAMRYESEEKNADKLPDTH